MKIWDYLISKKRKMNRKFGFFHKKFSAMNYCKNEIKTLVVGSSHGMYGYRAEKGEFNFCEVSQDLFASFKTYEYYADGDNLKNIILFYSVFSNGFELAKTKEKYLCASYKYFFDIPYDDIENDIEEELNSISYTFKKTDKIKRFYGNFDKYKKIHIIPEERIKTHLRENKRNNLQNKWLKEIINLAKNKNHNVYICIAPAREDYRKLLPQKEELFNSLDEILKIYPEVKLLNLFDSEDFDFSDFCDTDHLNLKGAKKLTKMIKKL